MIYDLYISSANSKQKWGWYCKCFTSRVKQVKKRQSRTEHLMDRLHFLTILNQFIQAHAFYLLRWGRTKKNGYEVTLNLELQGRSTRKYPSLAVGDEGKVMRKTFTEKERSSHWSKETRLKSWEEIGSKLITACDFGMNSWKYIIVI